MTPVQLVLLVFAALLGLAIGSFLNVVAYRLPAGIPLTRESRCPHCDAAIRPWQNIPVLSWLVLRGRCASCHGPISARYPLVEATTGALFAVVGYGVMSQPLPGAAQVAVFVAYAYAAALGLVLALIDLDTHRLPNTLTLSAYPVTAVALLTASALGAGWDAALRAVIGAAALFLFYGLLRLISPRGMGGGDVKLAGVLGAYLGFAGYAQLVVGAFAAFVLGGIFGIGLLLTRRAQRGSGIPFGPWMILGSWLGIAAGGPLAGAYLELVTP